MDAKWVGYGMCKALWKCEPGYSESMGERVGNYSILEDRECLISLLVALTPMQKLKLKMTPELQILREAADNKVFDEYLLYDVVLPKMPSVAYQLPEKTISDIKDYILKVRNK